MRALGSYRYHKLLSKYPNASLLRRRPCNHRHRSWPQLRKELMSRAILRHHHRVAQDTFPPCLGRKTCNSNDLNLPSIRPQSSIRLPNSIFRRLSRRYSRNMLNCPHQFSSSTQCKLNSNRKCNPNLYSSSKCKRNLHSSRIKYNHSSCSSRPHSPPIHRLWLRKSNDSNLQ